MMGILPKVIQPVSRETEICTQALSLRDLPYS